MPPTDGVFLPRHASVAAEDLTAHVAVEHRLADVAEGRTANPAVEDRTAGPAVEDRTTDVAAEDRTTDVAAEDRTANPAVEDRTANPPVEDRTANPAAEDRSANPAAEDRSANPAAEDRTANPAAEDRTANPAEDRTANPAVEVRTANPAVEDRTANPAVEVRTADVAVEDRTADVGAESRTADVVSGPSNASAHRRTRCHPACRSLCPRRLDRRREHVLPLSMSLGRGRLGRRPRPDLLLWSTQARQQASRPDTCWARRALTSYYCNAFLGPPCPIARAGQTQDVVGRVDTDRSAVSDQGPVPQSASSFDPPLGGSNKLAHPIVRPGSSAAAELCSVMPISFDIGMAFRELYCGAPSTHLGSRCTRTALIP